MATEAGITSAMLHMLVFSAITKRSPDFQVVAVPMLRETFLVQQRHKAKDRKLGCYAANSDGHEVS